ncbi:MAG: Arc family DNA-binding protein [Acidobacteriia bacterium]|nr:Arc family DNA-binding protein [Terriglobia bacterium]
MPINLSIKNVPDELEEHLRHRAARNHRSLQGELLAIHEESAYPPRRMSVAETLKRVLELGLRTRMESAAIIRAARDGRQDC